MKIIQTSIDFDKETGTSYCRIVGDNNQIFLGQAHCHPEDADMYSERTGAEIAHRRAWIKMLQYIRDCEILPVVNAYKHLYGNISKSKNFNRKSYETRMIRRQLRIYENELARLRDEIAYERENLREYIAGKEKIYKYIRAK